MGAVISRFRRKKSTGDTLSKLDKQIRSMEQYGHSTEQQRRTVVGNLMVASVGLYVLALLLFYFYCRPANWREGLFYSTPLLVSPLLIVLLRTVIGRYYDWKLRRNRAKLLDMRAEKKRILEEVMDTETYKVAKELLDKYGNTELEKPRIEPIRTPIRTLVPSANSFATPSQLRQRTSVQPTQNPLALLPAPASPGQLTPLKGDQLPRPVMTSSGGAFDRLVDYLIGDGPGSRFALICSQCKGHNGMALPEEFEYLSYRCAYCRHPNAARKTRPRPPQLMATPQHTDTSDHKTSSEDSDDSVDNKRNGKVVEPASPAPESPPPADDRSDHSADDAAAKPEDMSVDDASDAEHAKRD